MVHLWVKNKRYLILLKCMYAVDVPMYGNTSIIFLRSHVLLMSYIYKYDRTDVPKLKLLVMHL